MHNYWVIPLNYIFIKRISAAQHIGFYVLISGVSVLHKRLCTFILWSAGVYMATTSLDSGQDGIFIVFLVFHNRQEVKHGLLTLLCQLSNQGSINLFITSDAAKTSLLLSSSLNLSPSLTCIFLRVHTPPLWQTRGSRQLWDTRIA